MYGSVSRVLKPPEGHNAESYSLCFWGWLYGSSLPRRRQSDYQGNALPDAQEAGLLVAVESIGKQGQTALKSPGLIRV